MEKKVIDSCNSCSSSHCVYNSVMKRSKNKEKRIYLKRYIKKKSSGQKLTNIANIYMSQKANTQGLSW